MREVVAVVVTWRREQELDRLLASLEASGHPIRGCVVMDHAGTVADQVRAFPVRVCADLKNPGPGAGWANGVRRAQDAFGATDILYLDDDVVMPPGALGEMVGSLGDAAAVCPLLEDAAGKLWGFPEPADAAQRRRIRQAGTPGDALRLLGPGPHRFLWATGACLLVSREAIAACGLHRPDFWMLGEDLEYSMRLAQCGGGVFTCRAAVPHLPPPSGDAAAARTSDYRKFCSLLQNLSYLSFHVRHSAHMASYLPGNFRRFFRTHGWRAASVADAWECFRQGALCGHPAGHASGARLRERIARRQLRR